MNLLCPNCSKMLTVPEQYAGQMMKCPLCSGTFTVPALPPGGAEPSPAAPPEPAFSSPAPDPYQLQSPVAQNPSTAEPAFNIPATPEPAFQVSPPAPPPPVSPTNVTSGPSLPPNKPLVMGDYAHGFALRANPEVLKWVPAAALLLVFILQWFPWIGIYYGDVAVATQGAWGAAFGVTPETNADLGKTFTFTKDSDLAERNKDKPAAEREESNRPGISLLLLFYMLFFVPGLLVTLAVAALPFIKAPLPPQVQQVLPWRWGIVAGINAVLLLFLGLQLLLSFGLESSVTRWVDSRPEMKPKEGENTQERTIRIARRTSAIDMVQRTFWPRLVFVLHILATLAAALVFWMDRRGPAAPPPAVELKW